MVDDKDDQLLTYTNSKSGLGILRIVEGVNRVIYISDTEKEEGHHKPTIEYTIYIKLSLLIPIDFLNLEVKP